MAGTRRLCIGVSVGWRGTSSKLVVVRYDWLVEMMLKTEKFVDASVPDHDGEVRAAVSVRHLS